MNRYTWRTGVLEGVMIVVALIFMIPIYVLINLAVRPLDNLDSPLVPTRNPIGDHFVDAWVLSGLGQAMVNSAIVAVVSVTLLVIAGSLAAYALARATTRWSAPAFYLFMLGLLVPFQLGLVPLYSNFAAANLLGTFVPLIVIYVGLRLPFTMFLFTTFLRQIPPEYEEAAAIDGAGIFGTFVRITFPLLRPITGTVVILNGLFVWNDFLTPLLYLGGTTLRTVPLAIYSFVNENTTVWPLVFAGLVISVIPVLVAFFVLQKSLIQGFASGIKG
ncbi:MAG: carbohydrate ABC transporter permease [Beutenbergiaceae bacterium]